MVARNGPVPRIDTSRPYGPVMTHRVWLSPRMERDSWCCAAGQTIRRYLIGPTDMKKNRAATGTGSRAVAQPSGGTDASVPQASPRRPALCHSCGLGS